MMSFIDILPSVRKFQRSEMQCNAMQHHPTAYLPNLHGICKPTSTKCFYFVSIEIHYCTVQEIVQAFLKLHDPSTMKLIDTPKTA